MEKIKRNPLCFHINMHLYAKKGGAVIEDFFPAQIRDTQPCFVQNNTFVFDPSACFTTPLSPILSLHNFGQGVPPMTGFGDIRLCSLLGSPSLAGALPGTSGVGRRDKFLFCKVKICLISIFIRKFLRLVLHHFRFFYFAFLPHACFRAHFQISSHITHSASVIYWWKWA